MTSAPRLIVVSSRAPREPASAAHGGRWRRPFGGLADALDLALRSRGGTWIGGIGTGTVEATSTGDAAYAVRSIRLKERELRDHFTAFATQVLWPLSHTFPDHCRMQPRYWAAYRQVNERFAAAAAETARPGDLVWAHDFPLALVPGFLRSAGVPVRTGIFWHVPFPPPTVFGILRWRADILGALLGADVVGFQTEPDVENFLASVRAFLDLPVHDAPARVSLPERDVRVAALPVGVDHARLRTLAAEHRRALPARRAAGRAADRQRAVSPARLSAAALSAARRERSDVDRPARRRSA